MQSWAWATAHRRFVQGLAYYRDADANEPVPGLMNVELGGYHVGDIEIVAAFDISAAKVGRDVAEAIFAEPNNTQRFAGRPARASRSSAGRRSTASANTCAMRSWSRTTPVADVAAILEADRDRRARILSPRRLATGDRMVCRAGAGGGLRLRQLHPGLHRLATEVWRKRFEERGLPIIGDDIKSQVGATIVHRVLTNLFRERGVRLDRTYQLNFGGNTDFQNMLERERLESKKISKTQAVTSQLDMPLEPDDIHVGPSDHVPWLTDRKWCYIRMEGTTFGGVPLNLELKLEVWDSPNSAGVVIDAVRCAKLALDRGSAAR